MDKLRAWKLIKCKIISLGPKKRDALENKLRGCFEIYKRGPWVG